MTPLVYPKAAMPVEQDSLEYNMKHPRTGHAIIFNHEEFAMDNTPSRMGSKLDANRLRETLEWLGFSVTIYHDLDSEKIKMRINEREYLKVICYFNLFYKKGKTDTLLPERDNCPGNFTF